MAPTSATTATIALRRRNKGGTDDHDDDSPPPSLWLTFCASILYHISFHLPLVCCTAELCFIVIAILPPVIAGILWQRIKVAMHSSNSSNNNNNNIDSMLFYVYVLLLILLLLAVISYLSFCFKVSQAYCKNRVNASASTLQARARQAAAAAATSSTSSIPRVVLEDGYDLYLPPIAPPPPQDAAAADDNSSNNITQNQYNDTTASRVVPCGFFLFPGALVDYRSYAAFAMQLSDEGIVVVVQNTEPFRFVAWIFGSNHEFCQATMQQVQTRYKLQVQEWNVGGHSMGGYTCFNLVHKLPGVFTKLAFYGVYRAMPLRHAGVDVLAVTASLDGFGFANDQAKRDFFHSLPPLVSSFSLSTTSSSNESSSLTAPATSPSSSPAATAEPTPPCSTSSSSNGTTTTTTSTNRTIHYDIPGGNHAGFGDNLIQTFPRMDGERTISLEEQHAQMAKVTCQFLLNRP